MNPLGYAAVISEMSPDAAHTGELVVGCDWHDSALQVHPEPA